jgi:hypothetical protein
VEYCSGGGVATEYCTVFAKFDDTIKIEKKSLVKLTLEEMNEILRLKNYRLYEQFLQDNYVYLVNPDGTDGVFKGFNNNVNAEEKAPYLTCPVHNKEAWEKLLGTLDPNDPNHPNNQQNPSEPTDPATGNG